MIIYAPAKINIGLKVLNKRPDNYHNLDSIFYPIPLNDIIEVNVSEGFSFESTGLKIGGAIEDNLVFKAFQLMIDRFDIKGIQVHLHKLIPMGAGLGGGSSDASSTLIAINDLFSLGLDLDDLAAIALEIGADCPFFIYNHAMRVTGVGDVLEKINLDLSAFYILLINPSVHISTAQAYSGVNLEGEASSLNMNVLNEMSRWKYEYTNSFEKHLFDQHAVLAEIKDYLYQNGAIYASMSGSGSTMFGIFKSEPKILPQWKKYFVWIKKL